ncbi:type II toxin-antitoxin system ParD family antitoxin [Aerophototrophica crusticola]|uniref:Type II toxin-antitoxin system ParD family antitoxin n=1 Tax=Aerophototrophica crusticola TaxID=1709002 RepID=A0A858RBV0_9PROT|nr:type II toxin-antitoxin system ParD family antitoxin [Rhodospirillaceae bacterium B3]
MAATRQINVTLPTDLADLLEQKVRSGGYASANDVVVEGVRALLEQEDSLERWLREEVVPGYEAYRSDPDNIIPADQVLARIKARRDAGTAGR